MPVILPVEERVGPYVSPVVTLHKKGWWQAEIIGLSTAEYERESTHIRLALEIDPEEDGQFEERFAMTFDGVPGGYVGRAGTTNPVPFLAVNLDGLKGVEVRIVGETLVATTWGLDVFSFDPV